MSLRSRRACRPQRWCRFLPPRHRRTAGGALNAWQEDLLDAAGTAVSESDIFARTSAAAKALGFDYCAYGFRAPLPASNPRLVLYNNYPVAWAERYQQQGYVRIDPTVQHGRRSQAPIVWSDEIFRDARPMWDEAQACGLAVGWAQSSLDAVGVGGMLSLARSGEPLSPQELESKQQKMRWLVHISHLAMARVIKPRLTEVPDAALTGREVEILKWTADGKSSQDIADILLLSKNTVDFHLKNAVAKMKACNKTAAVVRAAVLGYLN